MVGFNSTAVGGRITTSDKSTADGDHLEVVDYESLLHFRQSISGDLNLEEFVSLSFSHHMEILNKTKTLDERLFYIHEAVINKWDKYLLRDMLKGKLYKHQGEMHNGIIICPYAGASNVASFTN